MLRDWYKFFLLAVPTPTEATKNLFQPRCISFILNRLYDKKKRGAIYNTALFYA